MIHDPTFKPNSNTHNSNSCKNYLVVLPMAMRQDGLNLALRLALIKDLQTMSSPGNVDQLVQLLHGNKQLLPTQQQQQMRTLATLLPATPADTHLSKLWVPHLDLQHLLD